MKAIIHGVFVGLVALSIGATAEAKGPGNPTGAQGSQFAENHPRRNEVNKRVDRQRARINEGVRDGKLTPQQAQQLRANDRPIKQQEHAEVRANGGHLTPGEQKQLNQEENANSTMIRDEKHPAQ
jgi:hypothetical protein